MANPFLQKLVQRADNRFSEDTLAMSNTDWIEANTTLRGKPYSVAGFDFQRAIIDDNHPNMDVKKCSQVGLTESQIRKALCFLMRNRGTSAIFTLPDEKMYERVSKTRIKPIVDKDQVFNGERDERAARRMDLMQFGDSFLYVTGMTESDATSIPADAVFNDEVDLSAQNMLALFNSRLQGSDYRINQRFGTPTFPAFGIDLGFGSSDQCLYLVRCDGCGHWNHPEFDRRHVVVPGLPDHVGALTEIEQAIVDEIDVNGSFVCCEKCHAALDLGRTDNREWVATYPGRNHARGYHVTPFCTPKLDPAYIITQLLAYKKRDYLRGFYNTVLGEGYTDGNIRLEREFIEACMTGQSKVPEIDPDANVWVGIDMGQTCHITLGEGDRIDRMHAFSFEAVHVDDLHKRIDEILKQYRVVGGAIDRHPYEPTADAVFDQTDGKIVPVEYRGMKEIHLVNDEAGNLTHAQANRTTLLDEVRGVINAKTLRISGYGHHREVLIEHLRDMVRDEQPEKPATWVKLTGNDHYFHSLGFMLSAMKVKEVERIKNKDDIRTEVFCGVADMNTGTHDLVNPRRRKTLPNPLLGA